MENKKRRKANSASKGSFVKYVTQKHETKDDFRMQFRHTLRMIQMIIFSSS